MWRWEKHSKKPDTYFLTGPLGAVACLSDMPRRYEYSVALPGGSAEHFTVVKEPGVTMESLTPAVVANVSKMVHTALLQLQGSVSL